MTNHSKTQHKSNAYRSQKKRKPARRKRKAGILFLLIITVLLFVSSRQMMRKQDNTKKTGANESIADTTSSTILAEQENADTATLQTDSDTAPDLSEVAASDVSSDESAVTAGDVSSDESAVTAGGASSDESAVTEKEDIASLSNEALGYGQGVHMDELNRPISSVQYEEKYKAYNAHFVDTASGFTPDGKKKIYLTIDEGYEYGTTASILDTLKQKNVPATFFVTLSYARKEEALMRRMIDEGHVIGNHSATHPSGGLPSQDVSTQESEITETDAYIRDTYGYSMYLFRFPAGKFSEQSLAIVNNCNYKSLFWSYAYLDYDVNNQPEQEESLQKMIDRLHPGAIYLLHGQSSTNAAVMGRFIDQARELGYEFCIYEP